MRKWVPEYRFARVARHLEEEKARVALRQKVVWRVVLVQDLNKMAGCTYISSKQNGGGTCLRSKTKWWVVLI